MTSKLGFLEAVKDLRYLLTQGYNRESTVRFVGDRYQLNRRQRLTLYRAVYDEKTAEAHMGKIVPVSAVRGRRIAVDGYNTLITVESLMEDRLVDFVTTDLFETSPPSTESISPQEQPREHYSFS